MKSSNWEGAESKGRKKHEDRWKAPIICFRYGEKVHPLRHCKKSEAGGGKNCEKGKGASSAISWLRRSIQQGGARSKRSTILNGWGAGIGSSPRKSLYLVANGAGGVTTAGETGAPTQESASIPMASSPLPIP